jgi:hypothetical protein
MDLHTRSLGTKELRERQYRPDRLATKAKVATEASVDIQNNV